MPFVFEQEIEQPKERFVFEEPEPDLDPRRYGILEGAGEPISTITGKPVFQPTEDIPMPETGSPVERFVFEELESVSPKLGFMDKWREIKEEGVVPFVGFLSGAKEVKDIAQIAGMAYKLNEGTATPEEKDQLISFIQEANKDTDFWYKTLDVVSQMPAFMQEFIFTGGIYTVGKKVGTKIATKSIKKYLGKTGRKLLEKKIGKVGVKVAAGVAGATLQTPAMGVFRIASGTIERSMPKLKLTENEKGEIDVLIAGEGEDLLPAFTKALGDQWAETVSEHSGGLFGILGRSAKNTVIKTGLFSAFLKANPKMPVNKAIVYFKKMGYHGVINEMLEERLGEGLRAGLGVQKYQLPTVEQLGVELVSFSVPGVVQGIGTRAFKEKPETEPTIPEEVRTGLDQQAMLNNIKADLESGKIPVDDVMNFALTPEAQEMGIVDDLNALIIDAKAKEELAPVETPEMRRQAEIDRIATEEEEAYRRSPEARQELIKTEMPITVIPKPEIKKPTSTKPAVKVARSEKKSVEFIGMQERLNKPSVPLVNELDTKSTVVYDPAKHELTNLPEYEKAVAIKPTEPKLSEVKPSEARRKEIKAKVIPEPKPKVEKEKVEDRDAVSFTELSEKQQKDFIAKYKKETGDDLSDMSHEQTVKMLEGLGDYNLKTGERWEAVTDKKLEVKTTPEGKEISVDLTKKLEKPTEIREPTLYQEQKEHPEEYVPITRKEADDLFDKGAATLVARFNVRGAETTGEEGYYMRLPVQKEIGYGTKQLRYDEEIINLYEKYKKRYGKGKTISIAEREADQYHRRFFPALRDEKAFATKAIKPQDTITRANLKSIFAKMKNISTGVDKDGNFFFRPFGKPVVTIYTVNEIEGYIDTSKGRIPVGSFLGNTIELKTGGEGHTADVGTAWHEFTHYLEKNGILSGNDIKALDHAIGKTTVTEEDRATYVGDRLSEWQGQKNLRIKRVLKKIADFVNAIYEFVSQTRTARGVLADIETGAILSEKELSAVNQFAQDVSFSLKKAAKAITDNPNFVKWFGNSKVVDKEGKPLVVYHGTKEIFTKFDPEKIGATFGEDEEGFFFSSRLREAEYVAKYAADTKGGETIMQVYLSLKNPYQHNTKDSAATYIDNRKFEIMATAKKNNNDGIIINGRTESVYVAFEPTQIKSIYNTGAFGITEPDIMFATKPTKDYRAMLRKYQEAATKKAKPKIDRLSNVSLDQKTKQGIVDTQKMTDNPVSPEGFNMPSEGRGKQVLDTIQWKIQDKLIHLKKVQTAIEKQESIKLSDDANVYQTEELYHYKTTKRTNNADRDLFDPLIESIHKSKHDLEDVELFLRARHAYEANKRLQEINPKRPDNTALSGMSNIDADKTLRQYDKDASMQGIGRQIDAIAKATRQMMVEDGLATKEEIKAWENAYKYYIPLKREKHDLAMPKKGRGMYVGGKESKRRLVGSEELKPVNIIANIMAQHESTIIRAEKAKVGRAMLKLAKEHPNKEFWAVDAPELKPFLKQRSDDAKQLDLFTGLPGALSEVVYGKDILYKFNDNVLVTKIDGIEHTITFNEQNLHSQRIVKSLKNLGADNSNAAINILSKITRILAIVNTSANPEFIISNFARDIQTAGYNINDTEAKGVKIKIFKDVFKALQGIRHGVRGKYDTEWAKHYEDFEKAGAQTGWTGYYKNIEAREKTLKKKLALLKPGAWPATQRTIRDLFNFVSNENTAVENAIRLSTYKHLKDIGLSDAKAASAAKNLTVNFNRRGDAGQALNALYLFFNANAQGSVRLIYAAARSPVVRKMMLGTVGFAVMLDILNRTVGGDDDDGEKKYDKIPDWVKEHNLVIMRPSGDYFKIPLPWGYNTLHVLGQIIGEAVDPNYQKDFSAIASSGRLGSAVLASFNPMGSESSLLQIISPTIIDPFIQWAENQNFAGIPLRPEQNPFDVPKPEYQMYFRNARGPSKWIAKKLNFLTGGDITKPGLVDVSPEVFDLFIDTFTGGAGKFLDNTLRLPKTLTEKDVDIRHIPFVRRMYGEPSEFAARTTFYDNLSEIRYAEKSIKHYQTIRDVSALRKARKANAIELRFIERAKNTKEAVGRLRDRQKEIEKSKIEKKVKTKRIENIEKRIRRKINRFNKQYFDAKQ